MTEAEIIVHGQSEKVSWGRWFFASLPSSGQKIAARAEDGTLIYFRVRDVEHRPVRDRKVEPIAVVTCDWEGEDLLDPETEALLSTP